MALIIFLSQILEKKKKKKKLDLINTLNRIIIPIPNETSLPCPYLKEKSPSRNKTKKEGKISIKFWNYILALTKIMLSCTHYALFIYYANHYAFFVHPKRVKLY